MRDFGLGFLAKVSLHCAETRDAFFPCFSKLFFKHLNGGFKAPFVVVMVALFSGLAFSRQEECLVNVERSSPEARI